MTEIPTAPECIVAGCNKPSALTDTTGGRLWTYHAHYCSDCYVALLEGESREIEVARLVLQRTPAPATVKTLTPAPA